MVSWEYFSKRRGTTLSKFLLDIISYEDALIHFASRNVSPPSDGSLHDFYHKKDSSSEADTDVEKQNTAQEESEDEASKLDEKVEQNKKDWGIKTSKDTKKSS